VVSGASGVRQLGWAAIVAHPNSYRFHRAVILDERNESKDLQFVRFSRMSCVVMRDALHLTGDQKLPVRGDRAVLQDWE
jgi:hypothetical protein